MHNHDDTESAYVELVEEFVRREVCPTVKDLEASDTYPEALIQQMKEMGVFGLVVPEDYGGAAVSTTCFSRVTEALAAGWMSLSGAMGSHSVIASIIQRFGTKRQKDQYLPAMATGEWRAAMALTEPQGGSDLQGIRTTATRHGDALYLKGSKTWITNAAHADVIAVLAKTDPEADPPHRGMGIVLVPGTQPGVQVSAPLSKLGYKGIESCEVAFDDVEVSVDHLVGEETGHGFAQMMAGLELGRIQVASRALGVARAALEDSKTYAAQRETFGKPIWRHQAIGHQIAEMATDLTAARALVHLAAVHYDSGARADVTAGMAKLFASEMCQRVVLKAMRIHGAYGYSPEYNVERYYRDSPLMIIGEGTNEIQKNVIVSRLMSQVGS